jgi:hypothetical protein
MIRTDGIWFKDEHGRVLMLRGVNLGGNSKVPFKPNGATWNREGFFDHRTVSFTGRPFPLEEADEHFSRLQAWGLTFLRFLVTWEAIEHAGPGIYDEEYLDYLAAVVKKAEAYGLSMFIDPHQDAWSRFSGGDGAPGWTLEAVGFDLRNLHPSGAAILHQLHGDPFPRMIWPTNTAKLASATMFTLFFAGNDLAPKTKIDGQSAQEYLQSHFLAAVQQVASRLKDSANVVGYDAFNEVSSGWIGVPDASVYHSSLRMGACPSPYQSMLLGVGTPQEVDVWETRLSGVRPAGKRWLNQEKARAWLPGHECVWKTNGVWDVDATGRPTLLRPGHFSTVNGRKVDYARDYLKPYMERFATAAKEADPKALIFVEPEHAKLPPALDPSLQPYSVSAPHWYDGAVLYLKDFNPWLGFEATKGKLIFGPGNIRRTFAHQVGELKEAAQERLGGVPSVIGEIGIAYDMQGKKAFRTGDFSRQIRAMDRSIKVMEDTLLNFTLWNYTADNTNARGDGWNDEDLSIFSRDQQKDPTNINSGGRALEAVVRPYAQATSGTPLRISFNIRRKIFEYEFRHDPQVTAPTVFFVPNLQYPSGYRVEVSDGSYQSDSATQTLTYKHSKEKEIHKIVTKCA